MKIVVVPSALMISENHKSGEITNRLLANLTTVSTW